MSGLDLLKRHLEWLEQDRLEVSEKLFTHDVVEKMAYEDYMKQYVKTISHQIRKHEMTLENEDLPCVIISSTVTVVDEEDGERMDFKIVSPRDEIVSGGQLIASYLSPIGKAMLMKTKDERVEVSTPQGVFYYRIERIKLA